MMHPGGMTDNSPTFERWGWPTSRPLSLEETADAMRDFSAVPSGLNHLGRPLPNVETLGYCRVSLRDSSPGLYFQKYFCL
jgi:hypothetical protein